MCSVVDCSAQSADRVHGGVDGGSVSYDQTAMSYFRPIGSHRPQLWTGVDVRFSAYSSKTNTKILVFVLRDTYNSNKHRSAGTASFNRVRR